MRELVDVMCAFQHTGSSIAKNGCVMPENLSPFFVSTSVATHALTLALAVLLLTSGSCGNRYTPIDPPYVSHADGLALHTAYIEKFWGSSVSMYDFLVPEYKPVHEL